MKNLTLFLRFIMSFFAFIGIYALFTVYWFGGVVSQSELTLFVWIGAGLAAVNTWLNRGKAA